MVMIVAQVAVSSSEEEMTETNDKQTVFQCYSGVTGM